MKLHLLFILIFSVTIASAQEIVSQFRWHGFSEDLRYAILETYSDTPIGESGATCKFIFVDVDKNSYAANTVSYDGTSEEATENVYKTARVKADPYFKKFKVTGKKPGRQVEANFTNDRVFYKVVLTSIPTGEMDPVTGMYQKSKMDLSILCNGKTKILQKDTKVPASRGFVTGYEIKAIYVAGNKIAVVVEYGCGPGFEGAMDKYDMLVTGVLN